ncbi:MAG TPA: hypothetical protein VFF73_38520 [Planctomycetota bacterium]|nr:hypothetical protein [Planctomycetota bacterium]
MSHRLVDLARLPRHELEHLLRYGERPDHASLSGYVFKGANVTVPGSLMFPRFSKGFFVEEGRAMGYNVPVERGPLDGAWYTKPREDPKPFGFYEVLPMAPGLPMAIYPNSVLLDYSKGGNWSPDRLLRDFLVLVEPNNPDLLLGKAYLALGVWVSVGFFVLERWGKAPARPPR